MLDILISSGEQVSPPCFPLRAPLPPVENPCSNEFIHLAFDFRIFLD